MLNTWKNLYIKKEMKEAEKNTKKVICMLEVEMFDEFYLKRSLFEIFRSAKKLSR